MAPPREKVLKATLTVLEPKAGGSASELDRIELPFNPKEWSITHAAEWKSETTKKRKEIRDKLQVGDCLGKAAQAKLK